MYIDTNLIPKSIFEKDFNETNIGWCSSENVGRLYNMDRGTVLVPMDGNLKYIGLARRTRLELIRVENPKKEFIKLLDIYNPKFQTEIHESAIIGEGTTWGDGLIVEENVVIGSNCSLNFDGFGYEDGYLIPHKGRVVIKSGTRIGNNVCIDRAVIGDTLIGNNVKIDNLVHIAHGVKIGEGSYIIAGTVICGSVVIGKNVWVAPNVSIRQHLVIGDNAKIGLGSVVVKNVLANKIVCGNPAKDLKQE